MQHEVNPWTKIDLQDYELHMGHPDVYQLQELSSITKEQLRLISEEKRWNGWIFIGCRLQSSGHKPGGMPHILQSVFQRSSTCSLCKVFCITVLNISALQNRSPANKRQNPCFFFYSFTQAKPCAWSTISSASLVWLAKNPSTPIFSTRTILVRASVSDRKKSNA